ncbi:glycoside hydrolase family 31 protein [Anaerocolumna chitinilytica]|uniref:Glycosyl hydrolase n=1 Tax=Anaerocolumna chitinilytica TaxID=1727145 RepID=A0A7I8DHC3_9FIRM|nr:glycoside hydrolase family 31 protein [Anaerocolumna chitinilytica]BCJ97893.1 glycosyl hydrolase [Anaerocolumna chitinilytica]
MGILSVQGNKIYFQKRDEIAVLEAWGKDTLRFRSTPNSSLTEENWNLLIQEETKCTVKQEDNTAVIVNGILSAKIYNNGKVTYFKHGKEILTERSEMAFLDRFREYSSLGADNHRMTVVFQPKEGEHFYGLGQEQNDCFDLKGSSSRLIHKNTKSSIPFVYSSYGYGFLWNNPAIGRCELTNNHSLWEADSTKQIDYLVVAGDTPGEVMAKYADLTGHAPAFPSWGSGFWQCKLRYEDQEELLSVAREYKRRGIPLSAIIIDYFHWTEQGEYKMDPKYWPSPKEMCDELENMGVKAIVSIWPTINPNSENFSYMDERNMLIRTDKGQYGIFPFYGQQTYIDPSNPETAKFVWSKVYENYYKNGIKSFWLDEAEPEILPVQFENLRFHKGNGAEVGLIYPYYYNKLFYDGLKEAGEEQVISLTRAAWIGSQKVGALVWSGDIPSTFDALRMSVKTGLNMAMCGIPWWNSDIGGFWGGDIESDYFRELIVRWFQFGIFCPVTRLHGSRKRTSNQAERNPGILERSGGDNEIWSFGEKVYPILKNLIELRERLRPYIHKYMDIASKTGASIMRPMFFEYPEDEFCYTLGDQYMFGEEILFAPIVNQGQTERKVYLPKGTWIDINEKKEYEGGTFVTMEADIEHFIAFVKKDNHILSVF